MACGGDPPPDLNLLVEDPSPSQISANPSYDFVEEPSQDFFCPVTLELLVDPHLTLCCGNHLSQEAASRLQRDGKPCPMCKEPQLKTVSNKHYKRKVNEIKVYCPHKKSGCEWVGEVNDVIKHSDSCPKRPWQCQYCEFESTYDIGVSEHVPVCTKYPIVCPNCCEVGSVARCDVESHLMVCPLQPVTCEYAEVGCDVKVPRRDLDHHMKEGQQHHLMSATLLILRLTREHGEERNRFLRIIEEKDEQLKHKDVEHKKELATREQQVKRKDETIIDLQKQLKQIQDGLDAKVTDLQQHVEYTSAQLGFNVCASVHLPYIHQGFSLHDFTLTEFKKCQALDQDGNWYGKPFYTHSGGYKFQLNIRTNGCGALRGICVAMFFRPLRAENSDQLGWPVTTVEHVQLLNQLGDHSHHEKISSGRWGKDDIGIHRGGIVDFFKLSELGPNPEKNTQYLKDDCLKLRVYIKV